MRYRLLPVLVLLVPLQGQDQSDWIITANRAGLVELIDPATLGTTARIHVDLPPQTVGLNGIAAGDDGRTLYLDGPIPDTPMSCCAIYSIDLATLDTRLAASFSGTASRNEFLISDGVVYHRPFPARHSDLLHISPNGLWLFGVQSFRGPALNIYDLARGALDRTLKPQGLEGDWWPVGTWSDGNFYLYFHNEKGLGRLWTISPDATELGQGIAVTSSEPTPGCSPASLSIAAAAGTLFLYEAFGFKIDRRNECEGAISGGAWILDPASGKLTKHVAPNLHFSTLFADRSGATLYGLTSEDPGWQLPSKLVSLDPASGAVLHSRDLEADSGARERRHSVLFRTATCTSNCPIRFNSYSNRSARIGFTDAARRAGIALASNPTSTTPRITEPYTAGSRELTPKSRVWSNRTAPKAPASPSATPASTSSIPPPSVSRIT